MFTVKLADLAVRIENKYPYVENMCRDYLISGDRVDFAVCPSNAEIEAEGNGFDKGYLESLAVYRRIAEKILEYDGFLMHGAVIEAEGRGIAFLARSGVGKSTHINLWKQLLGDKCEIINGDKPLIRYKDGRMIAYGTPWGGKEGWNINKNVVLTDLCFLERSEKNGVEKPLDAEIPVRLMQQIYIPSEKGEKFIKTLELADKLIGCTEQYKILCNKDISAAETVYKKIMRCGE